MAPETDQLASVLKRKVEAQSLVVDMEENLYRSRDLVAAAFALTEELECDRKEKGVVLTLLMIAEECIKRSESERERVWVMLRELR